MSTIAYFIWLLQDDLYNIPSIKMHYRFCMISTVMWLNNDSAFLLNT